ncbi:MAG TPA: cytochrome c [Vicinamibacterales bacterium]|jgi:mono/diheme cytochrome c family protein|nr:cytochrome c [Vicinamibacterales bacterium]
MTPRRLVAGFGVAVWAVMIYSAVVDAQDRKTVWDKVFTAEQAAEGKATYEVQCAGCHSKDLSGQAGGGQGPELAGNAFTKKWDLQTLNQLYTEISTRMPRNQPRSLTSAEYLSLVAYILQSNKFPAGEKELTADTAMLTSTFIAREASKAAAAPAPITTGTLVQVIGCLQPAGGGWALTQASAPVKTENPDASSQEQRTKLAATPAGGVTLQLLGLYAPPEEHKGHRMEGKGFIVKDPGGDRLNVVSLEMVATSCG